MVHHMIPVITFATLLAVMLHVEAIPLPLPGGLPSSPPIHVFITPVEQEDSNQQEHNDEGNTPVPYVVASGDVTPNDVSQYCEEPDKEDISPAIHALDAAKDSIHTVMTALSKGVEASTHWSSSCGKSFSYAARKIIDDDDILDLDVITGKQYDKTCSFNQQAINSSIPYLKCYAKYLGQILMDVTGNITSGDDSPVVEEFRQAVYEAYENVTGISDLMQLAELFPCQQSSHELLGAKECSLYHDITVTYKCKGTLCSTCFKDQIPNNPSFSKQIAVLTKIAYFLENLEAKLQYYSGKCLQPPSNQ